MVLIGQASLDVRDSEADLIDVPGASSLNLSERLILDSSGRVFEVIRAVPGPDEKPILLSMGTSPRRFVVEVREKPIATWDEVRHLLLAQVNDPRSRWAGDSRAVAKIQSLKSGREAVAACRSSGSWME